MKKTGLKDRTKRFALRIIHLAESLPRTSSARSIGNQILRSGTSVAANFRAACRAKSNADFLYKLAIVEEEADETLFWLELISESGLIKSARLISLIDEANQIVAVVVASINTTKRRSKRTPH